MEWNGHMCVMKLTKFPFDYWTRGGGDAQERWGSELDCRNDDSEKYVQRPEDRSMVEVAGIYYLTAKLIRG